ncbi:MAG: response regulator [Candidatus Aminicenantes bacterium]|nr:MAG: response regulator [Candidatus Aminicenantes bacterium]
MNDDNGNNNKPSLLIVDDDNEVLISFKIWLEGEGFRALTAVNSSEALKIIEEEKVEVALLDFRLGTENGLAVAKMLNDLDVDLKIIIITGYPSYETAVESIKSGLFDYLSKGEPNEKILETIKKALQAREKEIQGEKKSIPQKPLLKFIVICKHSLIKERLESFSLNHPDFKLIKTYNSIEHLKEKTYVPEVDLALVCASCCTGTFDDSLEFFNALYQLIPGVKPILFNESFSEEEKINLIKFGVKGFCSIDMDSETLRKALTLIKKGEMWASRRLISLAVPNGPDYLKNYLSRNVESFTLSYREKDILKAMVLGLKNKEIADKLFISENTVKTHISNIFKKFGVNNRAQAILFSLENKIF